MGRAEMDDCTLHDRETDVARQAVMVESFVGCRVLDIVRSFDDYICSCIRKILV